MTPGGDLMANYWLKLYYKMLRDPDIAALPAGG